MAAATAMAAAMSLAGAMATVVVMATWFYSSPGPPQSLPLVSPLPLVAVVTAVATATAAAMALVAAMATVEVMAVATTKRPAARPGTFGAPHRRHHRGEHCRVPGSGGESTHSGVRHERRPARGGHATRCSRFIRALRNEQQLPFVRLCSPRNDIGSPLDVRHLDHGRTRTGSIRLP